MHAAAAERMAMWADANLDVPPQDALDMSVFARPRPRRVRALDPRAGHERVAGLAQPRPSGGKRLAGADRIADHPRHDRSEPGMGRLADEVSRRIRAGCPPTVRLGRDVRLRVGRELEDVAVRV